MRQRILLSSALSLFLIANVAAQKTALKAFAITSEKQGQQAWNEVKLIDLQSGEVLRPIYQNKGDYNVFNARNGNAIKVKDDKGVVTDQRRLPFSSLSAACAYDKKHNRLYYTPMFVNELRYFDLDANAAKIYYFEGEKLTASDLNKEENHITRMVIGADGNGYAMSNDAKHLIRFSTGRKPIITDLGAIHDDAANGQISVHNRCTSWGGDLIAAANGDLYLVSAYHSIFKIDIDERKATYVGGITGLPANYTTNGAAVANDGKLIVSSATSTDGYYLVDTKTWKATKMRGANVVFNTSDLANANLAFQDEVKQEAVPRFVERAIVRNARISVYPNPVSEGVFRVSFDTDETGRYDIQLIDMLGRTRSQTIVFVANKGQVAEIELNPKISKGMYLVKVVNNSKKTIHADKVVVE